MLLTASGAEFLTGLPNNFIDVDSNEWYTDYVLSAQKVGIVGGISADEFGVGRNIIRQDAALMLERALGVMIEQESELFSDDDDIADYASGAVYAMRKTGLINGYEGNIFKPLGFLSRAEAAVIIVRFLSVKNQNKGGIF